MGYEVEIITCNITIPADKVADCLAAINALPSVGKCYDWVDNPPAGGFKDIRDAFTEWRYETILFPDGSVSVDSFNGEKWGDDPILYAAIAPFVLQEEGKKAIIKCHAYDGSRWRYLFKDGVPARRQIRKPR